MTDRGSERARLTCASPFQLLEPPRFWMLTQPSGPQPSCLPTQPFFLLSISWSSVGVGHRPAAVSAYVEGSGCIHTSVKCWRLQSRGRGHLSHMLRHTQQHKDTAPGTLSPLPGHSLPRRLCHDVTSEWERGGVRKHSLIPYSEMANSSVWQLGTLKCSQWENKVPRLLAFFSPVLTGHQFCAGCSEDTGELSQGQDRGQVWPHGPCIPVGQRDIKR